MEGVDSWVRKWATINAGGAAVSHRYVLATFAGSSVGYTFLAVTCALVGLAAATSDLRPGSQSLLHFAPLRALGKYSYAVYVFHKPLHDFVGKPILARLGLDATRSTVVAIVYIAVAFAASFTAGLPSAVTCESAR